MGVTLKFALIGIPLGAGRAAALCGAGQLEAAGRLELFRTLFYLPSVIPVVAGVMVFQGVLNAQSGWINLALKWLGIDEAALAD